MEYDSGLAHIAGGHVVESLLHALPPSPKHASRRATSLDGQDREEAAHRVRFGDGELADDEADDLDGEVVDALDPFLPFLPFLKVRFQLGDELFHGWASIHP
jgi:hypothetical protein